MRRPTTILRHALRSLGRTPRMFACAVVCLAGAIGAATAVFAIVNAVILRPLPFQHANRLVAIWCVNPVRDTVKRGFSWPDIVDLSRAARSLDGVAALANAPTDPLSAALAGSVAGALALLTAYVTARSAARIDPLVALRTE